MGDFEDEGEEEEEEEEMDTSGGEVDTSVDWSSSACLCNRQFEQKSKFNVAPNR